jgi:hypothetical protein
MKTPSTPVSYVLDTPPVQLSESEMMRGRLLWRNVPIANAVFLLGILVYAIVRAVERGANLSSASVSGQTGDVLAFAALCGVLAYATVEIAKRLMNVRGAMQIALTRDWLARREGPKEASWSLAALLDAMGYQDAASEASADRPTLAPTALAAPTLRDVFNLPPDQLVAQIASAVDGAIASPDRYGSVLQAVLGYTPRSLPHSPSSKVEAPALAFDPADTQALRAALDTLQTELTARWRRTVQAAALWVAGAYGIVASFAGGLDGANQARYLFAALILGGPIAWVIRDLTATLERIRGQV